MGYFDTQDSSIETRATPNTRPLGIKKSAEKEKIDTVSSKGNRQVISLEEKVKNFQQWIEGFNFYLESTASFISTEQWQQILNAIRGLDRAS